MHKRRPLGTDNRSRRPLGSSGGGKVKNHFDARDLDESFLIWQRAIRVSTGVGKTGIATKVIAEATEKKFFYTVPTLRLAEEVLAHFDQLDVHAKVFRGRDADDPLSPGDKMCRDPTAVEAAIKLGLRVWDACCSGRDPDGSKAKCPHYDACGYTGQLEDEPRVWIAAHNLLFHDHKRLPEVHNVVIDEAFWQAGLNDPIKLTLDQIASDPDPTDRFRELWDYRKKLERALRTSAESGEHRVTCKSLVEAGLDSPMCLRARKREMKRMPEPQLWPGMPDVERQEALRSETTAREVMALSDMWMAASDLLLHGLRHPEAASGRLTVEEVNGEHGKTLVAAFRGLRRVVKRWARTRTLIIDATLPDLKLLQPFYEFIEKLADIDVAMPHVTVRKVLGAPVSMNKLFRQASAERNLKAIRRAILARYVEFRRQPTL